MRVHPRVLATQRSLYIFPFRNLLNLSKIRVPVQSRPDFHWICMFGFILATMAGYVNAVCLIATTNVVSHHTGTATWLGRWIATGMWYRVFAYHVILIAFMLGSAVPGYFVHQDEFHPTRVYGIFLIVIGILLFIVEICFWQAEGLHQADEFTFSAPNFYNSSLQQLGVYIASFACGIQNAMCTQLTGSVVRTTHVSGLCTDVGIIIGRYLSGQPSQTWRLKVLFPILIGFVLGAALGTWVYQGLGANALAFAGAVAVASGSCWISFRVYNRWHNLKAMPVPH